MGKNIHGDIKTFIVKQMITEHYSTVLVLNNKLQSQSSGTSFKKINYERLKYLASKVNWLELLNEDVNICTDNLVKKIENILELAVIKQKKIIDKNKKFKKRHNWVTKA